MSYILLSLRMPCFKGMLSYFHRFSFFIWKGTLVPEVFLDFSSRKRSRASREAATTSRESDEEREKNLWLPWPRISLSDPDPVVCMKVRFEAKVTRGFSLSPRRFRDSLSPLPLDLFREEKSRKTSGTRVLEGQKRFKYATCGRVCF